MTLTDLAMVTLGATTALFLTSIYARRPGRNTPTVQLLMKVLATSVLGLAGTYFYMKYVA